MCSDFMLLDGIRTIDSLELKNSRLLLRLDLNSPVDRKTGKIESTGKIVAAARTLDELLSRGAAVAILAHQGRPGDYDFISLKEHCDILREATRKNISFVEDICGETALRFISELRSGEAILLDNVRRLDYEQKSLSAEEHAGRELVVKLSPHFDYFVNDAFAAIHRPHCSVTGFTFTLPSAAGRLMEDELSHISILLDNPSRPSVYVFGGKKFSDFLPVLRSVASDRNVDAILLTGMLSIAFLFSTGVKMDERVSAELLKEADEHFIGEARHLLSSSEKIRLPSDLAFNVGGQRVEADTSRWPAGCEAWDIGAETISAYTGILKQARTVFISGPAGVYEHEGFDTGTRAIFEAGGGNGKYSVIGGGHTAAAASQLGYSGTFSYVSTGGGALEALLSRQPLTVLEDLRKSALKFKDRFK